LTVGGIELKFLGCYPVAQSHLGFAGHASLAKHFTDRKRAGSQAIFATQTPGRMRNLEPVVMNPPQIQMHKAVRTHSPGDGHIEVGVERCGGNRNIRGQPLPPNLAAPPYAPAWWTAPSCRAPVFSIAFWLEITRIGMPHRSLYSVRCHPAKTRYPKPDCSPARPSAPDWFARFSPSFPVDSFASPRCWHRR